MLFIFFFFFQAEDGIRDAQESRGLGDVYKRQVSTQSTGVRSILHMSQPSFVPKLIGAAQAAVITIGPYVAEIHSLANKGWDRLAPYHPEELLTLLMGLVLCFFGGAYVTTITAAEAFRVVAWEQVKTATLDVWGQYRQAVLKAAEQEPKNETAQQAFTRKVTLAVQGCEPEVVNKALVSGQAGLMAVVAVLRIKFAQTITFGASLATQIKDLVAVGWLPKQLESALAPAYHKWIPTIIDYSCKIFGISCAWTVQRGLFAFHTSIRGGKMLARGGLSFTAKLKGFDAARYEGCLLYTSDAADEEDSVDLGGRRIIKKKKKKKIKSMKMIHII
eukprot:TRINITY_DN7772_c0_g1_i6.p1 TRINITY_DN7772_c0_g1~~TRINITY_DN7772_c0_g1_i6.p1  ORF type:complete len:332 (+),score=93.17 TRINITY_DN7772_c0_g1_i6:11-1006(+)